MRRLKNLIHFLLGKPLVFDMQNCSREQPHDGPCNGWPCRDMLNKMGADNVIKFPESGSWIAVKATPAKTRGVRVGFENWDLPA